MNTIKQIIFTSGLLLSTNVLAQPELSGMKSPQKEIEFSGNWRIGQNYSTNEYIFNGNEVINHTNENLNNYSVLLYFVPNNVALNQNNYQETLRDEYFINSTSLEIYKSNGNLIKVNNDKISKLKSGLYKPLVIVKNIHNNIVSYDYLELTLINNANSSLLISDSNSLDSNNQSINSTKSHEINQNTKLQSDINLIGQWKLEVDFNNLLLKISGIENAIKNKRAEATNKLRLTVTFVENLSENDNTISGYTIKDVDIEPIPANGEVKNTIINTNFITRIPQGNYYPVLILSELDNDGTYKIKSTIKFKEKYTL